MRSSKHRAEVAGGRKSDLGQYLADWLEMQRARLQPSTWVSYRGNVERYIVPALGGRLLDELTAAGLNAFHAQLLRRGGRGGRALSVRTVVFLPLGRAPCAGRGGQARACRANVASLASCPRRHPDAEDTSPADHRLWTPAQVRTFLAFAVDDPLRELWEVAIGTGMRRGELLGLRWDDIDLGRRALHVRRTLSVVEGTVRLKRTKTNRGPSLHVDQVVVAALGRRAATQAREAAAIPAWENGRDLMFTGLGPTGKPLDPMRITHAFTGRCGRRRRRSSGSTSTRTCSRRWTPTRSSASPATFTATTRRPSPALPVTRRPPGAARAG